MNYNKKTVKDIDVRGKKVLLRCDFNIPRNKSTGAITDEGRITSALPTIHYLLEQGAAIIACSHLGRPKGEWKPEFSLDAVAVCLEKHINKPVKMSRDVIGEDAKSLAATLLPGEIMLLENVRFHKEEEKNDPEFAKKLADMADIFVSDSFGTVHRAHASTEGVAQFLPAVAGLLLEKELNILGKALDNPKRPLVAILGGSKVSDKLGVINNLLEKADALIIGGGMSYTFIKAQGGLIGKSICEDDRLEYAIQMIQKAKRTGVKLMLPSDTMAAAEFSADALPIQVPSNAIPDHLMGLDIGPAAIEEFSKTIHDAGTVLWNGPMGVFEFPGFANGTVEVARALTNSTAISIICGGDSAAAARQFGFEDKITHISTGGGASLEFLEGVDLPGVACLLDK